MSDIFKLEIWDIFVDWHFISSFSVHVEAPSLWKNTHNALFQENIPLCQSYSVIVLFDIALGTAYASKSFSDSF